MTTIRLALSTDAKNLAALAIQVWLHTYAWKGIRASLSEYVLTEFTEEKFQKIIDAPDQIVIVAEIDKHLVAYAALKFDQAREDVPHTNAELATLYVQEHFTKKNIGSKLLAACAQHAQIRNGNPAFWLKVNHQNTRAINFYRKHGYTQCGTFFFELDGELHENFVLARRSD
jgi:ribosomal protein S18 acetylase RimI-like enzyme